MSRLGWRAGRWAGGVVASLVLAAASASGISIVYSPQYVGEADPEAVVTVYRGSTGPDPVSVRYQTEDGTALAGRDYEAVSGVLDFGTEESFQTIHVPIFNDAVRNGNRTFRIRLFDPSAGAAFESSPLLTVIIQDNERGYEPVLASDSPDENSGEMRLAILRSGEFAVSSAVSYRVIAGRNASYAAVPDRDFTPVSGVATFGPGETRWEFAVPILDDQVADGWRQVRLELFNPVGGVPIAGAFATEWGIGDDDLGYGPGDPPEGRFGWIAVREREGPAVLRVTRWGDFEIASSVAYEVVAASSESGVAAAASGRDFEVAQGILTFAPGQTQAEFQVFLHADHDRYADLLFEVRLSDPSDGVPIWQSQWEVLIRDTDSLPARVDPGFNPASVAGALPGAYTGMDAPVVPQSAGGLLAAMDAEYLGLPGRLAVVRLLADGAIDPTFAPFPGVTAWSATPEGICHVLTDDRRILRLTSAGLPDSGFSYAVPAGGWIELLLSRADGGVWMVEEDDHGLKTPRRLGADGQPDPAFVGPAFSAGYIRRLVATPSGGLALGGRALATAGGGNMEGLAVCAADGTLIGRGTSEDVAAEVVQAVALPDGRFLAVGYLREIEGFAFFRTTASGSVDPSLAPTRGTFVIASTGGSVWLLELNETTGLHRVYRRQWDGDQDSSWSAPTVEIDLRTSWQNWGLGGGCGVCDWCWLGYGWEDALPTLAGDGKGGLYLGSVARVNGHLRRGLARLDLEAPARRLEISPGDVRLGEDAGATTVTVFRGGDAAAAGSYRWQTAGGSARAGLDYQPAAGVVEFGPGERDAVLPLVLIDNHRLDSDRTVQIEFTDESGRRLPPAIVTLVNDDLGFLPGGIVAPLEQPWRLHPTGHLVRRGYAGGVAVVGSPTVSRLRTGQEVGWADALLPETLIWPVEGTATFLSLQP